MQVKKRKFDFPFSNAVLAENDLAGALRVDAVPATLERDHRAHRLARRVEGEDLDEGLVGVAPAHGAVVLAEVQHEAEQRALRLVADLLRLLVRVLRRLKEAGKADIISLLPKQKCTSSSNFHS